MPYPLIIANILMAAAFAYRINTLPPQIPIFFSRPWGEFQIADWWFIFLLPVLMNILYFLNLYIYNKVFIHDEFVKKIFFFFNLFLISGFTFIFLRIIFLVS